MSRQLFIQYLKTQSKTDTFRFYVYFYIRCKDSHLGKKGTVYYCGKGQLERAWKPHGKIPVPKDLSNIVIISYDLSEVGAFGIERRYIKWYGRKDIDTGILLNLTDGGEGSSGRNWTEEQRKANSGENHPGYGKKQSDETRKKKSIAKTGTKQSEEHIMKGSEAKRKKIPIRCIETGEVFNGPYYVAEWLNHQGTLKPTSNLKSVAGLIDKCCKGIKKSAYGYTWEYVI